MEFDGKVVLITGAGSGIGAAAAKIFASKGATLSLTDLNGDWLEKTAANILESSCVSKKWCIIACILTFHEANDRIGSAPRHELMVTIGDLTDENVREKFVNDTLTSFGKIDILLNVAGMCIKDSIFEADLKIFQQTLNLNLVAPFHLSGLCSQHLSKTKGCIINVSSGISDLAVKDTIAYCVSKAALDSLTKCMAVGFGSHHVRVNSIRPGGTATNIGGSHVGVEVPRSLMEQLKGIHLLNRISEPEEVAEMIAIIASEKCSFMTGTNLLFDGGYNVFRAEGIRSAVLQHGQLPEDPQV